MKTKLKEVLIVLAVGLLIITPLLYTYGTQEVLTITIKEKERVRSGDSDKYLVWADSETFENSDSLLHWKFNSSDTYGQLEVGKTYVVRVYGWRISFLSYYRNIITITEKQ